MTSANNLACSQVNSAELGGSLSGNRLPPSDRLRPITVPMTKTRMLLVFKDI
jgi:hypothetical protein